MPRETANYVPKLEAIKRIVSDPGKYGIELPDVGNEPFFVRVTKPRDIDLKTAAELAGMSEADFRVLNPSFKLPVIVASHNRPIVSTFSWTTSRAGWIRGSLFRTGRLIVSGAVNRLPKWLNAPA